MSIPRFGADEALSRQLADYERRLRALERSARMNLTLLDEAGNVAAELNGDGITSGDYVADTAGYKLGADSEVNSLSIRGGNVQALGVIVGSDGSAQTVSTTEVTFATASVSIPTWAERIAVMPFARFQMPNTSGVNRNFTGRLYFDDGSGSFTNVDSGTVSADTGFTRTLVLGEQQYTTVNGTTIRMRTTGQYSGGSHGSQVGVLDMIVIYLRD